MDKDATIVVPGSVVTRKKRSTVADFFIRLVKEKPLGTAGGVIVLVLLLVGIFANFLAPYEMNQIHLQDMLNRPSAKYLLGTDQLGRDVLSRLIYGAQVSLIVGLSATTLSTTISAIIGVISGFVGGRLDTIVQRFVDAWMAFPGLLLLITVMSLTGTGLLQIILVMGVAGGVGGSRVVRSAVIGIKENLYVEAARATGSSISRTLIQHILPNIMAPMIIIFSSSIGGVILAEASLSFLGYGVPPGTASWGSMLSMEGRTFLEQAPWLAFYPGLALSIVIYGTNMLGDAVRDLLDPRLRGGVGRYSGVKIKKPR